MVDSVSFTASFSPDRKLYPVDTVIKTIFAIMATLAWDEMTMVNGVVIMIDSSDLSMKHQLFWGMDNMKKMVTLFQVGFIRRNFKEWSFVSLYR